MALVINGKAVDWSTVEIGGIDRRDHPDYVNAYYEYCQFDDGTPLTDNELDQLNIYSPACVRVYEKIYC